MSYLISKDKALPFRSKIFFIAATGYAFSPIDLIPDFIPLLGYLDDILIIPTLIYFGIKFISKKKIEFYILKAKTTNVNIISYGGMLFVAGIYIIAIFIIMQFYGETIFDFSQELLLKFLH